MFLTERDRPAPDPQAAAFYGRRLAADADAFAACLTESGNEASCLRVPGVMHGFLPGRTLDGPSPQ